ncbi:MAG: hypothetical protein J6Q99_04260 [Oscillospiraceae bacterium]|nr:hypothetical protein [Oscillospiraceae bacterium]
MAYRRRAQNKYQSRTSLLVVVLLLVAMGLVGLAVWLLAPSNAPTQADNPYAPAQQGALAKVEIVRETQHDQEEFHYLLNATPSFNRKGEKGSVLLENSEGNLGYMQVEYWLEGGQRVYLSPIIPSGWCLPADKLETPLEKGEYAATAVIYVYSSVQADEEIGCFEEEIQIVVG